MQERSVTSCFLSPPSSGLGSQGGGPPTSRPEKNPWESGQSHLCLFFYTGPCRKASGSLGGHPLPGCSPGVLISAPAGSGGILLVASFFAAPVFRGLCGAGSGQQPTQASGVDGADSVSSTAAYRPGSFNVLTDVVLSCGFLLLGGL